MRKQILITRERAINLMAGGCPLDYLDALPRSAPRRKPFRVEELGGYSESRVYILGPQQVGYVIALRIGTEQPSGVVVKEWTVEGPWPDHAICWDYEGRDVIPRGQLGDYWHLLDSRLMQVLNNSYRVRRDYPIEGLLCGYSYQAVPEFKDRTLPAKVILVDDNGNRSAVRVKMVVIGHRSSLWIKRPMRPGQRDDDGPMPPESDR